MKLFVCIECKDIQILQRQVWRWCACRASGGVVLDGINAVIYGASCMPLGFANSGFVEALRAAIADERDGKERQWGRTFPAFVIPWNADSIARALAPPMSAGQAEQKGWGNTAQLNDGQVVPISEDEEWAG